MSPPTCQGQIVDSLVFLDECCFNWHKVNCAPGLPCSLEYVLLALGCCCCWVGVVVTNALHCRMSIVNCSLCAMKVSPTIAHRTFRRARCDDASAIWRWEVTKKETRDPLCWLKGRKSLLTCISEGFLCIDNYINSMCPSCPPSVGDCKWHLVNHLITSHFWLSFHGCASPSLLMCNFLGYTLRQLCLHAKKSLAAFDENC